MFDQLRGRCFTMSPAAAANPVRTALGITPSAYPRMIIALACEISCDLSATLDGKLKRVWQNGRPRPNPSPRHGGWSRPGAGALQRVSYLHRLSGTGPFRGDARLREHEGP